MQSRIDWHPIVMVNRIVHGSSLHILYKYIFTFSHATEICHILHVASEDDISPVYTQNIRGAVNLAMAQPGAIMMIMISST